MRLESKKYLRDVEQAAQRDWHEIGAWLLGATILTHWAIVARHERAHRDGYVRRMLPFTHQQQSARRPPLP